MVSRKTRTVLAVVIAVAAAILLSALLHGKRAGSSSAPAPESYMYFEEDEYDFGLIHREELTERWLYKDFIFHNTHKSPLYVLSANTSCTCLFAEIPEQAIEKGESGVIKVRIDSEKEKGKFYRQVYVKTTAADNYVWVLRIRGEII